MYSYLDMHSIFFRVYVVGNELIQTCEPQLGGITSESPVKIQYKSRESRRNPGSRIFTGSATGPPKVIFSPKEL
jgi:hypothetical protein